MEVKQEGRFQPRSVQYVRSIASIVVPIERRGRGGEGGGEVRTRGWIAVSIVRAPLPPILLKFRLQARLSLGSSRTIAWAWIEGRERTRAVAHEGWLCFDIAFTGPLHKLSSDSSRSELLRPSSRTYPPCSSSLSDRDRPKEVHSLVGVRLQ